uniref:Uncharacterized protein n=1 Tax=Arundo donax TaxID=35708 RepID=A0A0A9AZF8_ARUDO
MYIQNYDSMEQTIVIITTSVKARTCTNARGLPVHYFMAELISERRTICVATINTLQWNTAAEIQLGVWCTPRASETAPLFGGNQCYTDTGAGIGV